MVIEPPIALLAELTHRCPLACWYCSNPVELARARDEMPTAAWLDVLRQAAELGVLHVHFSGGEPLVRRDLAQLVSAAAQAGLYSNLITSGLGLTAERLRTLAAAGLDHVQLSLQDSDSADGDRVAGGRGAQVRKREAARLVRDAGLPLTLNVVLHRANLPRLGEIIGLAISLQPHRIELAHVQYHGWALANRALLMPMAEQAAEANALVAAAQRDSAIPIDYVPADYFARRPKACMGGWGRQFIVVNPAGRAQPCHAAETIPGLDFEDVRDRPLGEIWRDSSAFNRFRGTSWMAPPCRGCPEAVRDWGGCRCQALALLGDAAQTDPVCSLSPHHMKLHRATWPPARHASPEPLKRVSDSAS